jgi:hypothetical protein
MQIVALELIDGSNKSLIFFPKKYSGLYANPDISSA